MKLIIFLLCLLVVAGCGRSQTGQKPANTTTSSTEQPQPSPATSSMNQAPQEIADSDLKELKPKLDACALLTNQDLKSIQGEVAKETKLSGSSEGGFNVSQCFFTLPTFVNSVSLAVMERGYGPSARDPKQLWKDTFHDQRELKERGSELKEGRNRGEEREGEEEEERSAPPLKIAGIGDEAFWAGGGVGAALYVLKGHSYVRVSVGGRPGDAQTRIKKSKALAKKVVERL